MKSAIDAQRGEYRLCESDFQLELSRGASYIASSRTTESLRVLVGETLDGFAENHGIARLAVFRAVLSDRLSARGRPDAVAAIATIPLSGQDDMPDAHSDAGTAHKRRQGQR